MMTRNNLRTTRQFPKVILSEELPRALQCGEKDEGPQKDEIREAVS